MSFLAPLVSDNSRRLAKFELGALSISQPPEKKFLHGVWVINVRDINNFPKSGPRTLIMGIHCRGSRVVPLDSTRPYLAPFPRCSFRHVQRRYIWLPLLRFTPDGGDGVPLSADLRKILHDGQRMTRLQNGIEALPKFSTGWVGFTNVTDRRQTDRRDGIATANTRM